MNFRQPNEDLFDSSRMSFGEHLEELRKVLLKAIIGVAIACGIGFLFANQVMDILNGPLVDAMGEFNRKRAAKDIVAKEGYVAPELAPWLEEEKFIPRQMRVDPAQLVRALQSVIPDFGSKIELDPYGFKSSHFDESKIPQLCRQLVDPQAGGDAKIAQAKLIWQSLNRAEQNSITQLAQADVGSMESVGTVLTVFNRLSLGDDLSEADEFKELTTEEDGGLLSLFQEQKEKPLAKMKAKLNETSDPNLARRMNRALLTHTFSDFMPPLKMDLVKIEMWESSEFEPQSLGVSEVFFAWMKTGFMTGLVLAGPWIFYCAWTFVATGLYPHEQKYVHVFLPISIALFVSGVLLAFYFVFQPVLGFLFSFNEQLGIAPEVRIKDWLGFVMFLPLGFGTAFQLPLVMLFMNRIGLFQVSDYLNKWRVAVMFIFVLAMVLTPADPISMLLLAFPMTILYFLGIGMCKWMPVNKNPFGDEEGGYETVE